MDGWMRGGGNWNARLKFRNEQAKKALERDGAFQMIGLKVILRNFKEVLVLLRPL